MRLVIKWIRWYVFSSFSGGKFLSSIKIVRWGVGFIFELCESPKVSPLRRIPVRWLFATKKLRLFSAKNARKQDRWYVFHDISIMNNASNNLRPPLERAWRVDTFKTKSFEKYWFLAELLKEMLFEYFLL